MEATINYKKIHNEGSESDDESFSSEGRKPERNLIPWIWCGICTIITIVAVVFAINAPRTVRKQTSLFPTDFVSAPDVGYTRKYFYNYYDFNPMNHQLEVNESAGIPLYSGPPTDEMDKAWDDLLTDSYMWITPEERDSVQEAAPWKLEKIDNQTYMEVGVFHNLHCINLIRKALEPQHYDINTDFTAQLQKQWMRSHVYHCIEHLRQSVQCHGDLTPVPLFSADRLDNIFVSHSTEHTCRDFDAIKRWRDERNKANEAFQFW